MTSQLFKFPSPFKTSGKNTISIYVVDEKDFKKKKLSTAEKRQLEQQNFKGKKGEVALLRDKDGKVSGVYAGYDEMGIYTLSPTAETLKKMAADFIGDVSFKIAGSLKKEDATALCIGWGLSSYKFETYKKDKTPVPQLIWPKNADKKRVKAFIESVCLIRNLVNTPTNDLNTDELAAAAKKVAEKFKATFKSIKGKPLEKDFPMIHAVGKGSPKPPQLIELNWGKKSDPKVTLVGKGIVFDTGGLNIKTGNWMSLMKKDMGGSAHALACAYLIMSLKLPIRLKVLLAAAENSIDGHSFRPSDVIKTRKGHTVEIKDTDAEGRLVLSDALAYACEGKPDLLIDFATLTGSARSALGPDIPATYSQPEKLAEDAKALGMKNDDPVWPMPLWDAYFKDYNSKIADFCNDGGGYFSGSIKAALFLKQFVDDKTDWIHLDCYAWEQSGKPGRPQGGADTGMRAIFHYLEKRYGKSK